MVSKNKVALNVNNLIRHTSNMCLRPNKVKHNMFHFIRP